MKRYTTILGRYISFLAALFMFVGCYDLGLQDDIDERPINFTAGRAYNLTRAATTEVQGALFDEGEEINVYIEGSTDGGTNWTPGVPGYNGGLVGKPTVYVTSEDMGGYNQLTPRNEGEQAYYPLNPIGGNALNVKAKIHATYPKIVTDYTEDFTVEYDQTTVESYKNSDLMFVAPFEHAKNNKVVNLPFKHKMAKLIITAIPDDGVTVDDIITVGSIKRGVKIDAANGDFAYSVEAPTTIPLFDEEESDYKLRKIRMINGGAVLFPPQYLASAVEFIKITGKDEAGQPQTAQFDIIGKTFLEGRVYKLNLHISNADYTPHPDSGDPHTSTITGWSEDYDELTVTPSGGYSGVTIADIDGEVSTTTSSSGKIDEEGYYVYSTDNDRNPVPCCPKPSVTYGDDHIPMIEGVDFRYQYVDNINAGNNSQVMIIGMGSYAGLAALKPFTIRRAKGKISFPAGSDKTGENAVVFNLDENIGFIKANNTGDGVVTYEVIADGEGETTECASVDPVDGYVILQSVGKCTIKATVATGRNFDYPEGDNTCTYKLEIKQKEVKKTNLSVTYQPTSFKYNGSEQKLTSLVVADGEHTLVEGTDYTYTLTNNHHYKNGESFGKAILTIKGKGNYSEESEIVYEIPFSQAKPQITLDKTTTLWLGIHNPSAPKDRRRSRVANTDDWASKNLIYTSENPSIVTVNPKNGLLTGVASGETNIIVSVPADNSENEDFIAADIVSFPVKVIESDFSFQLNRRMVSGYEEPQVEKDANDIPVGAHSEWICPGQGIWQLDCYGAQGASTPKHRYADGTGAQYTAHAAGGKGAHIAGQVRLSKGKLLYVNVGEQGRNVYTGAKRNTTQIPHGYYELDGFAWNGGGNVVWGGFVMMDCGINPRPYNTDPEVNHTGPRNVVRDVISGGGGATDISLSWGEYIKPDKMKNSNPHFFDWKSKEHLYSRIIVAGGGGGGVFYADEGGFGNGGNGGAWTGTVGLWYDYGEGGQMDRAGHGGCINNWKTSPMNSTTSWNNGTSRHQHIVYLDGPFAGGYSCSDGMFGEGGNYTQTRQGCGAGGGGWYGGGSGGEQSSNGSGGGGSSYLWSTLTVSKSDSGSGASVTMASLYDSIETDWNNYLRYLPSGTSNSGNWAYEDTSFSQQFGAISNYIPYMPTVDPNHTSRTGHNNYVPYMSLVTADAGVNSGDGWAKITLVDLDEDQ